MKQVTIPAAQPESPCGASLASLVAARLCHDFVSPLGAIGNGVELLEMSGDYPGIANSPELTLIGESVRAARARVQCYRMAFGHASPDQRVAVAEIAQLAQDYARGARLTVEVEGFPQFLESKATTEARAARRDQAAGPQPSAAPQGQAAGGNDEVARLEAELAAAKGGGDYSTDAPFQG